jgi:hypothetical protein
MDKPLSDGFDQVPTLALEELGVRPAWGSPPLVAMVRAVCLGLERY